MSKTRETIRLDPNKYKEYTEKKAAAAAASQSVVSWKTIDESEAQLGTQNRLHKTRESYTSALRHKQNKQNENEEDEGGASRFSGFESVSTATDPFLDGPKGLVGGMGGGGEEEEGMAMMQNMQGINEEEEEEENENNGGGVTTMTHSYGQYNNNNEEASEGGSGSGSGNGFGNTEEQSNTLLQSQSSQPQQPEHPVQALLQPHNPRSFSRARMALIIGLGMAVATAIGLGIGLTFFLTCTYFYTCTYYPFSRQIAAMGFCSSKYLEYASEEGEANEANYEETTMIDEKEEKEPKVGPLHSENESTEFDDALPPNMLPTTTTTNKDLTPTSHLPTSDNERTINNKKEKSRNATKNNTLPPITTANEAEATAQANDEESNQTTPPTKTMAQDNQHSSTHQQAEEEEEDLREDIENDKIQTQEKKTEEEETPTYVFNAPVDANHVTVHPSVKEDIPKGVDPRYSTPALKSSAITNDERDDNRTTVEVKLNSVTKANLENLQGLTRSRNVMLANAKKVLPKKYMHQYASFSHSSTLYQPKGNLDFLHSQCESILPLFRQKLTHITTAAGLDPNKVATWQGQNIMLTSDMPYTSLTVAPLKSKARCIEKAKNEYDGDVSRLIDITRASIVVDNEDQLIAVAKKLQNEKILRLKNRFQEPLFTGYSDALYNIEIKGIICEVQLHVSAIVAHKEENHDYYVYFRSFFAGNIGACEARIHMLEKCIDPDADVEQMLVKMLKSEDKKLMTDMIRLVAKMGDFYLEELLCRRLFELDPDHLEYKSMLAGAVANQGRYKEAEELFRQCLEVQKSVLWEDHPSTLLTMNNVANAVVQQADTKKQRRFFASAWRWKRLFLGTLIPPHCSP